MHELTARTGQGRGGRERGSYLRVNVDYLDPELVPLLKGGPSIERVLELVVPLLFLLPLVLSRRADGERAEDQTCQRKEQPTALWRLHGEERD